MTRCLRLCLFALLIGAMLSVTNTSHACIPLGGLEPACSAYWNADAVFVGSISEITEAPPEPNHILKHLMVHFAVEEAYRGVESAEVAVAAVTGTECDTKFQKGERWLVYAHRQSPTSRLEMWARTRLYSNVSEDMSYIRGLSDHAAESSVIARAFVYPYTPLEGIRIEIEGDGAKYNVTTDKEGQVDVSAVKPGRYIIRSTFEAVPMFPGGTRLPSRVEESGKYTLVEFQEDIKAGRCVYVQFFVAETSKNSNPR